MAHATVTSFTDDEKNDLLHEALAGGPDSEGFALLGTQIGNPVKEILDYEGLLRRTVYSRFSKEAEPDLGTVFEYTIVTPEEPPIFDWLARAQDRVRRYFLHSEDTHFRDLLAKLVPDVTQIKSDIEVEGVEAFLQPLKKADKLLIPRSQVETFAALLPSSRDLVTQRELMMAGYLGMLHHRVAVITSCDFGGGGIDVLEPNQIIGADIPEIAGDFWIHEDLSAKPIVDEKTGRPGWLYRERIQAQLNPEAFVRGELVQR